LINNLQQTIFGPQRKTPNLIRKPRTSFRYRSKFAFFDDRENWGKDYTYFFTANYWPLIFYNMVVALVVAQPPVFARFRKWGHKISEWTCFGGIS